MKFERLENDKAGERDKLAINKERIKPTLEHAEPIEAEAVDVIVPANVAENMEAIAEAVASTDVFAHLVEDEQPQSPPIWRRETPADRTNAFAEGVSQDFVPDSALDGMPTDGMPSPPSEGVLDLPGNSASSSLDDDFMPATRRRSWQEEEDGGDDGDPPPEDPDKNK